MRMQAVFHDTVIADSADTVVVEGNHYFPHDSLRSEYMRPSRTRTLCPWKGLASYYEVEVDGVASRNAAWYYPRPWFLVRRIKGRVAFWNGVRVRAVHDDVLRPSPDRCPVQGTLTGELRVATTVVDADVAGEVDRDGVLSTCRRLQPGSRPRQRPGSMSSSTSPSPAGERDGLDAMRDSARQRVRIGDWPVLTGILAVADHGARLVGVVGAGTAFAWATASTTGYAWPSGSLACSIRSAGLPAWSLELGATIPRRAAAGVADSWTTVSRFRERRSPSRTGRPSGSVRVRSGGTSEVAVMGFLGLGGSGERAEPGGQGVEDGVGEDGDAEAHRQLRPHPACPGKGALVALLERRRQPGRPGRA